MKTRIPSLIVQVLVAATLSGVLPTVVSPGAIWTELEPGFHVELIATVRINVLPNQRGQRAQIRRREPLGPVRPREHLLHHEGVNVNYAILQQVQRQHAEFVILGPIADQFPESIQNRVQRCWIRPAGLGGLSTGFFILSAVGGHRRICSKSYAKRHRGILNAGCVVAGTPP